MHFIAEDLYSLLITCIAIVGVLAMAQIVECDLLPGMTTSLTCPDGSAIAHEWYVLAGSIAIAGITRVMIRSIDD